MMRIEELQAKGFDNSEPSASEPGYIDIACSQCAALVICGVPCHETGCPNALPYECFQCGCTPVKYKNSVCTDCSNPQEEE